jgi:hypothetical protein
MFKPILLYMKHIVIMFTHTFGSHVVDNKTPFPIIPKVHHAVVGNKQPLHCT